jgi:hypothetical protein
LKGVVVFGLPTAFFKSFAENEIFEAAPLKDLINALFAAKTVNPALRTSWVWVV